MTNTFSLVQKIFLYLLLIIIGLYAGMLFFHEMCPVETKLTPVEYANYWRIVDGVFMHDRMNIMGPMMLGLFVITVLLFIKQWKSVAFIFLTLAFIAFILDVIFFNKEQAPINEFIIKLDLKNLTEKQVTQIGEMQIKSIANFHSRFLYGMSSFLFLCLTPFFLLRTIKKK